MVVVFQRGIGCLLLGILAVLVFTPQYSNQRETWETEDCPDDCYCFLDDDSKKTVTCNETNYSSLDELIPCDTEILNFAGNDVTYLSSADFRGTQKLQRVDLSSNKIYRIEWGTFAGLRSLVAVDLQDNYMLALDLGILDGLYSDNVTLSMADNPWYCNCTLLTTVKRFKDIADTTTFTGVTCSYPYLFRGRDAADINKDMCQRSFLPNDILIFVVTTLSLLVLILVLIWRIYRRYYPRINLENDIDDETKIFENIVATSSAVPSVSHEVPMERIQSPMATSLPPVKESTQTPQHQGPDDVDATPKMRPPTPKRPSARDSWGIRSFESAC